MSSQNWVEVSVLADGNVTADGEPIDSRGFADPYAAALAAIAGRATLLGHPVLVRGLDHVNKSESWFSVNQNGQTFAAVPPKERASEQHHHGDHQAAANNSQSRQPSVTPGLRQRPRTQAAITNQNPIIANVPTLPSSAPSVQPSTQSSESLAPIPLQPSEYSKPAFEDNNEQSRPTMPATHSGFVRPMRERPRSGIRRALFAATGGNVNLGPSAKDQEESALIQRISRQVNGGHNTAILSKKGGIGKTSTTTGVGMILAEYRSDLPCAIDANPDSGDLAERALGEMLHQNASPRTIADIIRDMGQIDSLTKLSQYMHQAGRLHLIAGEQDPGVSDSLSADDYLKVQSLISKYYAVTLTDCGTGISHPAMTGILSTSSNVVIAAGYAVSGAKRARTTIEWLADHGYEELASNAIVVITDKDQVSNRVDRRAIERELGTFAKTLVVVPRDKSAADGDQMALDRLSSQTRRAYMEIAAAIVDGYN